MLDEQNNARYCATTRPLIGPVQTSRNAGYAQPLPDGSVSIEAQKASTVPLFRRSSKGAGWAPLEPPASRSPSLNERCEGFVRSMPAESPNRMIFRRAGVVPARHGPIQRVRGCILMKTSPHPRQPSIHRRQAREFQGLLRSLGVEQRSPPGATHMTNLCLWLRAATDCPRQNCTGTRARRASPAV